jgi:YVTN family beta-propeller protein
MRVSIRNHAHSAPSRTLRAVFTILLGLICASCGETYRPVAQPILGLQPSPAPAHFVVSINTDGVGDNHRDSGSSSDINVSGDSMLGTLRVGIAPVHAALIPAGSKLYVANSAEDTVTTSNISFPTAAAATVSLPPSPFASITLCSGNGTNATYTYAGATQLFFAGDTVYVSGCATNGLNGVYAVTAASVGSFSVANATIATDNPESVGAQAKIPNAVFANTTENNNMYVAGYGTDSVYVINTTTDVVRAIVPVGVHPVALAEIPDARKVYVANHGNSTSGGSVSVIDTVSDTATTICLSGGSPPSCTIGALPIWTVAGSDSAQVYVLDESGVIYTINTASDTVTPSSFPPQAGANFMFYDKSFSRLYVTSPTSHNLSVFDVSGGVPAVHLGSPISIPAAASSTCGTSPVFPDSVTVLGDGSRAYVASYQKTTGGSICTQLSVVDTGSSTLTKTIPLTTASDGSAQTGCGTVGFRVFAASSGGGTNSRFKVYVSQCDAGSVAVVKTYPSDGNPEDTFAGLSLSAPLSTFPALPSGVPPSQNPVFMVAGP